MLALDLTEFAERATNANPYELDHLLADVALQFDAFISAHRRRQHRTVLSHWSTVFERLSAEMLACGGNVPASLVQGVLEKLHARVFPDTVPHTEDPTRPTPPLEPEAPALSVTAPATPESVPNAPLKPEPVEPPQVPIPLPAAEVLESSISVREEPLPSVEVETPLPQEIVPEPFVDLASTDPGVARAWFASATDRLGELEREESRGVMWAEVQVLVLKMRKASAALAEHLRDNKALSASVNTAFARASHLVRDNLNEDGFFVRGLRRDVPLDWDQELDIALAKRDRIYLERQAEADERAETEARLLRQEAAQRDAAALIPQLRDADDAAFLMVLRRILALTSPTDELLEAVTPRVELVRTGDEFRPLRRALRRKGIIATTDTSVEPIQVVANDLAPTPADPLETRYRGFFVGRRALCVGGLTSDIRTQTMREFFGFAELDWEAHFRSDRADGGMLGQRIANHRYDLVIVMLKFVSHSLSDSLRTSCRRSHVPLLNVSQGFSPVAVCVALDRLGIATPERLEVLVQ